MQSHYDEESIPESDRVYLNVGGTLYVISRYSLLRYPYTRLGKLAQYNKRELYFDRNPKLMSYILDLYRTGEFHVPRNCCSMSMKSEMLFWDIPEDLISECCWETYEKGDINKTVIDDIDKTLKDPYEGVVGLSPRYDHLWNTMTNPGYSSTARIWNMIYNTFVALATLSFVLASVPSMRYIPDKLKPQIKGTLPTPGQFRFLMLSVEITSLYVLDVVCWIFFTVEFCVRFLSCPRKSLFVKAKLNIMDMFLIVIVWIITILNYGVYDTMVEYGDFFYLTRITMNTFKAMRVLRLFTVLHRNEYTKVMILSLNSSLHPLNLLMLAAVMSAIIFGAMVYLAEISGGSYRLKTIAMASWWSYETMTAIGYGDIVPKTVQGYSVAIMCGISGVIILAMPIAIITSSFKQYMISLRTHKHRLARQNYIRNQGQQNAFRAMKMFLCKQSSDSAYQDETEN